MKLTKRFGLTELRPFATSIPKCLKILRTFLFSKVSKASLQVIQRSISRCRKFLSNNVKERRCTLQWMMPIGLLTKQLIISSKLTHLRKGRPRTKSVSLWSLYDPIKEFGISTSTTKNVTNVNRVKKRDVAKISQSMFSDPTRIPESATLTVELRGSKN